MRFLFLILFCLGSVTIWAQKPPVVKAAHRVILQKNDSLYQFYAEYPPDKKFKADPEKWYYWYYDNQILSTQGSHRNRLLNKVFQAFYPNKNLYQQGTFNYGLKDGRWQTWYPTGQLKNAYTWKKGFLHGPFTEYDETGKKTKQGHYKNNRLSGTLSVYKPDGTASATEYKDGLIAVDQAKQKNSADSIPHASKVKP